MGEIVAAMLPPRAASPKKEPESKFKSAESGYRPSGPDAEDQACCEDGPGTLLAVVISPPANSVAVSDVGAGRPEASKAAASHSVLQRTLLVAQLGCLAFSAAVLLPTGLGGSTEWGKQNTTSVVSLCPRESICSEGAVEVGLLFASRGSAYFIFPILGAIFLTKSHSLTTFLSNTAVNIYVPMVDLHFLHVLLGWMIAGASAVHVAFHIARWWLRAELDMTVTTQVGISGTVATLALLPICLLMVPSKALKTKYSWEIRKGAHMFCVVFGVALCFHTWRLGLFMGITMSIYFASTLYTLFQLTYRINNSHFQRLDQGVQLTFKNPPTWRNQTGYVNICVVWVSRTQWHPFSVYPHPTRDDHSAVCIMATGNWTRELHSSIRQVRKQTQKCHTWFAQ